MNNRAQSLAFLVAVALVMAVLILTAGCGSLPLPPIDELCDTAREVCDLVDPADFEGEAREYAAVALAEPPAPEASGVEAAVDPGPLLAVFDAHVTDIVDIALADRAGGYLSRWAARLLDTSTPTSTGPPRCDSWPVKVARARGAARFAARKKIEQDLGITRRLCGTRRDGGARDCVKRVIFRVRSDRRLDILVMMLAQTPDGIEAEDLIQPGRW